MRAVMTTTLTLAAALAVVDGVRAQGFQQLPGQQPAVSPYINLLRRGSSPAVNYYGLVRPIVDQQTFSQQIYDQQQLEGSLIQGLEQQPGEASAAPRYPTTGHPTQLLGHLRYFQTRTPASGSSPGQGLATPTFANRAAGPNGGPAAPRGGVNPPPGRGAPTIR